MISKMEDSGEEDQSWEGKEKEDTNDSEGFEENCEEIFSGTCYSSQARGAKICGDDNNLVIGDEEIFGHE